MPDYLLVTSLHCSDTKPDMDKISDVIIYEGMKGHRIHSRLVLRKKQVQDASSSHGLVTHGDFVDEARRVWR